MPIKTYDPSQVKVTFNGVEITGYTDDSLLEFHAWPSPPRRRTLDEMLEMFGKPSLLPRTVWDMGTLTMYPRAMWDRRQRRIVRRARKLRRGW